MANGTVSDLSCDFSPLGGPATGTTWAGPFVSGATFTCIAQLSGVAAGTGDHEDIGRVEGTGSYSGITVTDTNPYWANVTAPSTPPSTPSSTSPSTAPSTPSSNPSSTVPSAQPSFAVDAVSAGVDTGTADLGSGPNAVEIGSGIAGLLLAAFGALLLARRRRAGSDT